MQAGDTKSSKEGVVPEDKKLKTLKIDYSLLMDLRIDYAFKVFAEGNPNLLISLLNSIFANKKIKRVIKSIDIKNPNLDKKSVKDKLSILDVRAELDDGTTILIEMHMYGLGELKSKTIRSWARAYGEDLEPGQSYTSQPPTIVIAFTYGAVEPIANDKTAKTKQAKIHRYCMIMDVEDNVIFTNALELHYIDMKAFAKAVNEAGGIGEIEEAKLAKWLLMITEKEINNKAIIESACDEEEIQMAMTALQRQSEDKLIRQAYQRRQDEIYFYNKELADNKRIMEQLQAEKEKAEQKIKQAEQKTKQLQAEKEKAEQKTKQAEQKTAQAEQKVEQANAEIEELRRQIAKMQADTKQ